MVVCDLSSIEVCDMSLYHPKLSSSQNTQMLLDQIEPIIDEVRSLKVQLSKANSDPFKLWERIKALRAEQSRLIVLWEDEATKLNPEWCNHFKINKVGYW
jgi:hypothetical protein